MFCNEDVSNIYYNNISSADCLAMMTVTIWLYDGNSLSCGYIPAVMDMSVHD